MSNRSYTEETKDWFRNRWDDIKSFLDRYDAESWPAFGVFFAVITLGMFMSYQAFQFVVGVVPAALISLFFEASILAWKMTGNRKRNDAKQNQLSNTATWLSVTAAVSMLVVNLFRVGGSEGFENLAYIIVGVAALIQVVFYLLFSQADQDQRMVRDHNQQGRELVRKKRLSENVIGELEGDFEIIRFITQKLQILKNESADLPLAVRENLLENARKKLLAQFAEGKEDIEIATASLADIDGDGEIGKSAPKVTPVNVFKTQAIGNQARLEEIKDLPVDLLFEDELPTDLPTEASDLPIELRERPETDF